MKFLILVISLSVCELGCLVRGLWDLSIKDWIVPSYLLFQRIRDALEQWYFLQMKETEHLVLR